MNSDGGIDVLCTAQDMGHEDMGHEDMGHEVTGLEALRVTPVGRLVVGSAVDAIEYWTGSRRLASRRKS